MAPPGEKLIASNRRAFHDYSILERFEAGLSLMGTEVKSLRDGHASLGEAYGQVRDGSVWLVGASIEPYGQAAVDAHETRRDRRLLLHRQEIERIAKRTEEKGLTLVPLRLYFKDGRAKVEVGLGRGKDGRDRRQDSMEREARREIERATKGRERE